MMARNNKNSICREPTWKVIVARFRGRVWHKIYAPQRQFERRLPSGVAKALKTPLGRMIG